MKGWWGRERGGEKRDEEGGFIKLWPAPREPCLTILLLNKQSFHVWHIYLLSLSHYQFLYIQFYRAISFLYCTLQWSTLPFFRTRNLRLPPLPKLFGRENSSDSVTLVTKKLKSYHHISRIWYTSSFKKCTISDHAKVNTTQSLSLLPTQIINHVRNMSV